MSGAHILIAGMALVIVFGLSWTLRVTWKVGADILEQHRADRDELERWRVAMVQYERWLAEFPVVALVLESLQAEAAGRQLSMSPRGKGPYTVDALRERVRGFFQLDLVPIVSALGLTLEEREAHDAPAPKCGGTIQTAKGHYFDFLAPERSEFDVEVIAAALSKICRFTGHCRQFYSVAQHLVLASYAVAPEFAFEALHHDDEEAFLNDIAKPLKELLPDYQRLERRVRPVICAKFGLAPTLPPEVKHIDRVLLATEQRDFMPPEWNEVEWDATGRPTRFVQATERHPWWTLKGIEPLRAPIQAWSPEKAEREYLRRHYELLALRGVHAEKARAA